MFDILLKLMQNVFEQDLDLTNGYIKKIQELEAELLRVRSSSRPCGNYLMNCPALVDMASGCIERTLDFSS